MSANQKAIEKIQSAVEKGVPILGEIITWTIGLGGKRVGYSDVLRALDACGFERSMAKEFKPSKAFTRAAYKLKKKKVINILKETETITQFQVNHIERSAERIDYNYEAVLALDKHTGDISCEESPAMRREAERLLKEEMDVRSAIDITKMIQKLMGREADLFSIRDQGGVYFVPVSHREFLERVEKFIQQIGGKMNRFPIPESSDVAKRNVKDVVTTGLWEIADKLMREVDAFDEDSREWALKNRATQIAKLKMKLKAYGYFLEDKRADIEKKLTKANDLLQHKFAAVAKKAAATQAA